MERDPRRILPSSVRYDSRVIRVDILCKAGTPDAEKAKRRFKRLTERERQIAELLLSGVENAEISARLNISQRTVESHRANLYHKLEVRNADELLDSFMVAAGPAFLDGYRKPEKVGHYDLEPQIRIGLTNDGDAPVNLIATSLYVNDTPMHFEKFVVHPARYAELRLSDAAVDAVLAGKSVLIFIRE